MAVSIAVGCAAPHPPPLTGGPTPGTVVIARHDGLQGVVRVLDDGVRRSMWIGDTLHGERIVGAPASPLAPLLRALRPEARSAMVLGLGAGLEVDELAERGFDVDAVEMDPHVARFAERYFDLLGRVRIANLRLELAGSDPFEAIVLHPLAADIVPGPLADTAVLAAIRDRLRYDGILVLRLAAPSDEEIRTRLAALRWAFESTGAWRAGTEVVVVAGLRPLPAVDVPGVVPVVFAPPEPAVPPESLLAHLWAGELVAARVDLTGAEASAGWVDRVRDVLDVEIARGVVVADDWGRGVACDRVADGLSSLVVPEAVRQAVVGCAILGYDTARAGPRGQSASARLLHIGVSEQVSGGWDGAVRAGLRRLVTRIRRDHPDLPPDPVVP